MKAIGVANWSIPYLEELRKKWTVVPAVNQVELHPFLPQHALKSWCDEAGILLEAYSPLGSEGWFFFLLDWDWSGCWLTVVGAPLMADEVVQGIAERNGVSAAAVLISYHVNRGGCCFAEVD